MRQCARLLPPRSTSNASAGSVRDLALGKEALSWTPCVLPLCYRTRSPGRTRGRDHRGTADYGDEIARAPGFGPQHEKPLSELWNVTRSTSPAKISVGMLVLGAPDIIGS
jgi:hypothetical protein